MPDRAPCRISRLARQFTHEPHRCARRRRSRRSARDRRGDRPTCERFDSRAHVVAERHEECDLRLLGGATSSVCVEHEAASGLASSALLRGRRLTRVTPSVRERRPSAPMEATLAAPARRAPASSTADHAPTPRDTKRGPGGGLPRIDAMAHVRCPVTSCPPTDASAAARRRCAPLSSRRSPARGAALLGTSHRQAPVKNLVGDVRSHLARPLPRARTATR